ncbi:hypothetical protein A0U91_04240 [Acetobacter persici]|uniref:Uncharacterized protein n=1 Tax=Acetobacter persici TaxID=1076596 RepID=A0A1U9LD03_9PROT|nr:hypothetical protein A0U91_04240 [Acetobacter persici]
MLISKVLLQQTMSSRTHGKCAGGLNHLLTNNTPIGMVAKNDDEGFAYRGSIPCLPDRQSRAMRGGGDTAASQKS